MVVVRLKVGVEREHAALSATNSVVHDTCLGVLPNASLEEVGLALHRNVLHELERVLHLADVGEDHQRLWVGQ